MENSHNFTLNEAAKETGRSKGTISKALNNGK
jgi:DNA-binding LacI/PurR family transcriptional regulator